MKTLKLLLGVAAIAAAFAAASARAQSLPATLNGLGPQLLTSGTYNGLNYESRNAGILKFDFGEAFCVEPFEGLSFPETLIYDIQDPLSLSGSGTVSRLIGGYLSSAKTDLDGAAVQWAIWEVVLEGSGGSLSTGSVRVADAPVAALANTYLANAASYAPVKLTYLTNTGRQDVVTWNLVPEPSSLTLAGLSALMLLRRRR
jgi:hypothetical protein